MPSRPRVKRERTRTRTALAGGVAVSVALGEIACTTPAPPPPPPQQPAPTASASAPPTAAPTPSVAAPEPPPPAPDPSPGLEPYKVTNKAFTRRVLYTWTTNEQIEELLKTRVLLSRTESPQYGRSYYDQVMDARWLGGDKFAALLRAPAFQKARFAWPAAWATFLGWPGEKYGNQLIEVTLKPEAYIAMYRTSTATWEVRDAKDAVVPEAQAMKHPERIAAVFFVHDGISAPSSTATPRPSSGDGREAYREYVLCNESMIESWSVGTDHITRELVASADTIDAAAKYFAQNPPPPQRADRWNAHVALLVWPGIVDAAGPKELFEAALAFPNPNYVIDPEGLQSLANLLRGTRQVATSTTHQPTLKFAGAKPVPIPPPPPPPPAWQKKWRGTY